MRRHSFLLIFLAVWLLFLFSGSMAAIAKTGKSSQEEQTRLPEHYTPEQVDAILSRMSDSQVRSLLIKELQKNAAVATDSSYEDTDNLMAGLLQEVGSEAGQAHTRLAEVPANIKSMPADMLRALGKLSRGKGWSLLVWIMLVISGIFVVGMGIERLFRRLTAGLYRQIESAPPMKGLIKLWGALLKLVSEFMGIIIFALSSLTLYVLIYGAGKNTTRMLFIAALLAILISRLITALSHMICSPTISGLRLLPYSDQAAKQIHRNLVHLIRFTAIAYMTCLLFKHLGVQANTFRLMVVFFGTAIIFAIAVMIWKNRVAVAQTILSGRASENDQSTWLKKQFASIWHVLALIYLLLVWLVFAARLIITQSPGRGVFFISLLVVPIYLALDRAGQWIVTSAIGNTAQLMTAKPAGQEPGETEPGEDIQTEPEPEGRFVLVTRRIVRAFIFFAVAFWLLDIWGVDLPFGRALTNATFDILITLALAYAAWNVISNFISRKLQEDMPDEAEDASQEDSEWGSATTLGRSHTLLPMARKAIGTVLLVMVIMIVLSSIGVDIGPLLAGAGVLGIAIGFGARKLVSDVFSGFFFLIDDAFRVGEYLEAGGLKGRVEKITLRNLFLRHYRGMLQIVPYSDLGAITNFMRGGIVVKFNLQLPYDTDIDVVRKVIKKVGQKLLEHEEHGPNFIKPLKSQGVRDVGDSVMTIRVKYTAIPGKQFVIRREAYKLIQQALAEKGIHYAHRKVIVELPPPADFAARGDGLKTEEKDHKPETPPPSEEMMLAAGAAAFEAIKQGEKKEK